MWDQLTQSGQLKGAVLQGITGLVDHQYIQNNIILVDVNVGFSIDGVWEASQLSYLERTPVEQ